MTQLCIEDEKRAGTLVTIRSKYYAMQALAAALKWIELVHNTTFPPRTLDIVYRTIEGKMPWYVLCINSMILCRFDDD